MIADRRLAEIRDKVHAESRLTFEDGLHLEQHVDLFALGELANLVRERKNGDRTYYNVNTHLNPTNVCVYRCTFCSFRADLKSPEGYVMTDEQILARALASERDGATVHTRIAIDAAARCRVVPRSSAAIGQYVSLVTDAEAIAR